MHIVDSWSALCRHATMTAEVEAQPRPTVSPFRRPRQPAALLPGLSVAERVQYEFELAERIAFKEELSGMDKATAAEQARAELGCAEFWATVNAPVEAAPVYQPVRRARTGAGDLRAEVASWVALDLAQRAAQGWRPMVEAAPVEVIAVAARADGLPTFRVPPDSRGTYTAEDRQRIRAENRARVAEMHEQMARERQPRRSEAA